MMKNKVKRLLALGLSALLCMGLLAGCGSSFSATDLVKGNLDLIYLNQYTDTYLKSVNLTKDEAKQRYEDGIAVEVDYFCTYFNIVLDSCDETIEPQITELYHQIYASSKYELGGETKNGDTYLVELTIYPIDIIQKVMEEDADAFTEAWSARVDAGEFDTATETEFETAWAQAVIDMVSARLSTIGYGDAQTISVQVSKDTDDKYTISDNDFSRIDTLIIAY